MLAGPLAAQQEQRRRRILVANLLTQDDQHSGQSERDIELTDRRGPKKGPGKQPPEKEDAAQLGAAGSPSPAPAAPPSRPTAMCPSQQRALAMYKSAGSSPAPAPAPAGGGGLTARALKDAPALLYEALAFGPLPYKDAATGTGGGGGQELAERLSKPHIKLFLAGLTGDAPEATLAEARLARKLMDRDCSFMDLEHATCHVAALHFLGIEARPLRGGQQQQQQQQRRRQPEKGSDLGAGRAWERGRGLGQMGGEDLLSALASAAAAAGGRGSRDGGGGSSDSDGDWARGLWPAAAGDVRCRTRGAAVGRRFGNAGAEEEGEEGGGDRRYGAVASSDAEGVSGPGAGTGFGGSSDDGARRPRAASSGAADSDDDDWDPLQRWLPYDFLYLEPMVWRQDWDADHDSGSGSCEWEEVDMLGSLGLLDLAVDQSAVRHLRAALTYALEVKQQRFGRPDRCADPDPVMEAADDAMSRVGEGRRALEEKWGDWQVGHHQLATSVLSQLAPRAATSPAELAAWRVLVEQLRPGLPAAHPDTWGRLLGAASAGGGKEEEEEEEEAEHDDIRLQELAAEALADRRRMQERLGWRGYESPQAAREAVEGLGPEALATLLGELLQQGAPGDEEPLELAPPQKLAVEVWERLFDSALPEGQAAVEAARRGERHGFDRMLLLRSAVLGLLLLEGSDAAAGGPLWPPEPLACALVPPLLAWLDAKAAARAAQHGGGAGGARPSDLLIAPTLLYDVLQFSPLRPAGEDKGGEEAPSPAAGGTAAAIPARYALTCTGGLAEALREGDLDQMVAQAALGRAVEGGAPPAVLDARVEHVAVLHWATGPEAAAAPPPPPPRPSPAVVTPAGPTRPLDLRAGLYGCLFAPAAAWPPTEGLAAQYHRLAANHRKSFVLALASLRLMDTDYASTAVQHLDVVLCTGEAALCRLSGSAQPSNASPSAAAAAVAAAAKAAAAAAAGRRAQLHATCERCHRLLRDRRPDLGLPDGVELSGEKALEAAEALRPGLLEAHPETWGALLQQAGRCVEDERARREGGGPSNLLFQVLQHGLLGLWTLYGLRLPLERVRLSYCVLAGLHFRQLLVLSDRSQVDSEQARTSAVELFAFLAFVPCPWLLSPLEEPRAAAAAAAAAGPPGAPDVAALQALSSGLSDGAAARARMLSHSLDVYERCPQLAATLTECMLMAAEAAEAEGAEAGVAAGGGGGERRQKTAAEVEAAAVQLACDAAALAAEAAEAKWRRRAPQGVPQEQGTEEEEEAQWFDATDGGEPAPHTVTQGPAPRWSDAPLTGGGGAASAAAAGGTPADGGGSGRGGEAAYDEAQDAAPERADPGTPSAPLLGPGCRPDHAVQALRQLLSCCRWYRDPAATAAAALPPPAPTRLVVAGAEQMLLVALVLREAGVVSDWPLYVSIVFEPRTSPELGRAVLGREGQSVPPGAGEPAVVALDRLQPSIVSHHKDPRFARLYDWPRVMSAGGFQVTATSRWPDQLRKMRDALVNRRLGALWVQMVGAEGVRRALLMAATVRDAVYDAHGTTLFAAVVETAWPQSGDPRPARRKDRDGAEGADGGGGGGAAAAEPPPQPGATAQKALFETTNWIRVGQKKAELCEKMGRAVEQGWREWRGAAGWLGALRQELFAPGSRLGSAVRLELRLTECEPGRPDAPRLPLEGRPAPMRPAVKQLMYGR
ncbi:hypothetical protein GPECTOR_76g781 [Gonium pectorale]|uniref:Uncharacterized protein n=1 Tax=Gonium pectorale TaxID=33097 RepID=A0A150G3T3_GONPE|nr:hypothetical protein GPECTOR_76g781 [Gonium pectorale]|eukprot:KXZ43960.1 hypothetical protein GPECTOR_76g781 [Gonium pectorale]